MIMYGMCGERLEGYVSHTSMHTSSNPHWVRPTIASTFSSGRLGAEEYFSIVFEL